MSSVGMEVVDRWMLQRVKTSWVSVNELGVNALEGRAT